MKEFPDIVLHKDELEELKHYSRVDSVPINARKPSPILIDEGMVSRVYGPFIKDPLAGGFHNVTGYKISDRGNRFLQTQRSAMHPPAESLSGQSDELSIFLIFLQR